MAIFWDNISILDGQEIITFQEEWDVAEFGPGFSEVVQKLSWTDSQMDVDFNTGTKAELVQYYLRIFNINLANGQFVEEPNESMSNSLS